MARTRSAVRRAVGVAAGPVLQADRVALGVHAEALLAAQRALHRPLQEPGRERGLGLVAHVLLAAERAAVRDQLDGDPVGGEAEHGGDVVAVVPHALAAGVHVQPAVVARHRQRRLGLEERVLDALRLEHLVHDVGARGERGVDVAAGVLAHAQHVVVRAPHRDLGIVDGGDGIGDRPEHVVLDVDQLGRRPGLLLRLGDDDRQHVAGVGGAPALGDEDRPVLVDDADPQLAGDVGGGEHGDDARRRRGRGWCRCGRRRRGRGR